MLSLWETVGYMTTCACFNNLGFAFLTAPVAIHGLFEPHRTEDQGQ